MDWKDKRVLITGGTGSIGRALTEILIKEYNPWQVVLFSHSESKQFNVKRRFIERGLIGSPFNTRDKILFRVGDIGDYQTVDAVMIGCNIVIHLAAMKHISICEDNPAEAIRTNIEGTKNLYLASWKHQPDVMLCMSTDKAYGVPCSLYGHTKAISERLFLIGDMEAKKHIWDEHKTKFCVVRCGNILDSDGSVTQIWRKQIKNKKPITITDRKMSRFWISLPRIARFIIDSIERTEGGEIFIPEIGSCTVGRLAELFSKNYRIICKGDNEKDHEELSRDLRSDTNKWQLSNDELMAMLKDNEEYL